MKPACVTITPLSVLIPAGVIAGEWVTEGTTKCKVWDEYFKPGTTVSWSGQCVGGYASGSGTPVWHRDGKEAGRYEGQMKNGKWQDDLYLCRRRQA